MSYPTFRWLERGEGEPVVRLHGLMGEMDHWEAILEALRDVLPPDGPDAPAARSAAGARPRSPS